jgi:BCD family chlorophyll transporter-like MFS transporter
MGTGTFNAPLVPVVVALGVFNGMFAVAAIGAMMALASQGRKGRTGTRMGIWGAAQAIAAGFGGLTGALATDVMRNIMADGPAFSAVFAFEAAIFFAAALMAARIMDTQKAPNAAMIPGE